MSTPFFWIPPEPEVPVFERGDLVRIDLGDGDVRYVIVSDVAHDGPTTTLALIGDPFDETPNG